MNTSRELSYKSVVVIDDRKEYHRKKWEILAVSHIGDIPQIDEPTYDQKQWVLHKLKGPASTWRRCC